MKLRTPKAQSQRPIRPEPPVPVDHGYNFVRDAYGADVRRGAPSRRRRRAFIALAALIMVGALGAGGWFAFATVGSVHAAQITRDASPSVRVDVHHALFGVNAAHVTVTVDGHSDSAARVTTSGAQAVTVIPHQLSDGVHTIRVTIASVGAFRRTLHGSATVHVDTVAPRAKLLQPSTSDVASVYVDAHVAPIMQRPAQLRLDVEPGSTLELRSSAPTFRTKHLDASNLGAKGVWKVVLPEGSQQLTLLVRDAAGNVTTVHRRVLVDTVGPALHAALPTIVRNAKLGVSVTARDAHGVQLQLRVDGALVNDALSRTVLTPAPASKPAAQASAAGGAGTATHNMATATGNDGNNGGAGTTGDADPIAASFQMLTPTALFEGRHTVQLTATDSFGATTKFTKTVLVDSTEQLQSASGLQAGARGVDVTQLQQALIGHDASLRPKLAKEFAAKLYGAQTTAAVKAYQSSKGESADGVAGSDTLAGLTLKIVVDRATHQLTLFRAGSVVRVFSVAVGSTKYPTIPGSFSIINMQKDPTWTPPDSVWAKGAKPVGPGVGNPLGTRWMGLGGSVGIHGTDDPSSIGYSVSHGCIRMQIPDAEALFALVRVGTPVTII